MSYQPVVPSPFERGDPTAYSCRVDDPSGLAHGGVSNVFDEERAASGDGYTERTTSNNEEDVVEPELPAGPPSQLALKEASPVRATLQDKSNCIAIASVAAKKTQLPMHNTDSKGTGDENRHVAPPRHSDENMGVIAIPSLWDRFKTTPSNLRERTESLPGDTQRGEYKWLLDAADDTAHAVGQSADDYYAIDSEDGVEDRPMSPFMLPPPMMQEPMEEPERIVQGTFDEILESLPPVKSAFDDWSDDDD